MPALSPGVRSLFDQAVEIASESERRAFLDRACVGSPEARKQIEALLQACADAGSFLQSPPSAVVRQGRDATELYTPIAEGPGSRIGAYKLLQQIGEGGFGVVYMAEQQQPVRRKVALKIIKPGMDTKEVIARFESERQALALMDHPNIARVFDAGATESGRPYFVMELVKGIPITQFCDDNHLPAEGRLELFINICNAVQHAHQKGVIHRDLKPSNVMVTLHDGRPVPKVIDFGVAKATSQRLTERTLFTAYGQMIGTPAYMSPEQAEMSGLDIDTRSDIYSLGVLLYELLTGTTPFDGRRLRDAGYAEMQRIIREEEPPKPSTRVSTLKNQARSTLSHQQGVDERGLRQLLRGELDWIVMKSLEKDRERRYESASSFARDVLRYLSDEPVQACPPSTLYRARKLARRYKGTLATVAIVLVALIGGATIATWQAVVARINAAEASAATKLANEQRSQAQSNLDEANKARRLADDRLMETEKERRQAQKNLEAALAGVDRLLAQVDNRRKDAVPLPEAARRRVLSDALKLYDQLVAEAGDSFQARMWAGKTSSQIAALWSQIGEKEAARRAHNKAIELFTEIVTEAPSSENRDELAWIIHEAAWFTHHVARDFQRSAELFRRSRAMYAELLKENVTDTKMEKYALREAHELNGLRTTLSAAGKRQEAVVINEAVLELCESGGTAVDEARASALDFKAGSLEKSSPSEAEALYRLALSLKRDANQRGNDDQRPSELSNLLERFAQFQEERDPDEATQFYDEALGLLRDLSVNYSGNSGFMTRYVALLDKKAGFLRRQVAEPRSFLAGESSGSSAENDSRDSDRLESEQTSTSLVVLAEKDNAPDSDRPNNATLLAEAEALFNEAASLRRRLAVDDPHNPNRHALIDFVADQARKLRAEAARPAEKQESNSDDLLAEADRLFRQAILASRERTAVSSDAGHQERLLSLLREQALHLRQLAASGGAQASASLIEAQLADANALFNEAMTVAHQLVREHSNAQAQDALINTLVDQARHLRDRAAKTPASPRSVAAAWRVEAEELFAEGIQFQRQLAESSESNGSQRNKLRQLLAENASSLRTAGESEAASRRRASADAMMAESIEVALRLAADFPGSEAYRAGLVSVMNQQARYLRLRVGDQSISDQPSDRGDSLVAAEEMFRQPIAAWRQRLTTNSKSRDNRDILARLLQAYGEHKRSLADEQFQDQPNRAAALRAEGQAIYEEVIDLRRRIAADFPRVAMEQVHFQNILRAQARYLRQLAGRQAKTWSPSEIDRLLIDAQTAFQHSIEIASQLVQDYPGDSGNRNRLIELFKEEAAHLTDRAGGKYGKQRASEIDAFITQANALQAEAMKFVDKAIANGTKSAADFEARATWLSQQGQPKAAIADYSEAIRLNPANIDLVRRRGELYTSTKQYEPAIADFSRYLAHPGHETQRWAIKRRGTAYFYAGQYDNALADLRRAVELGDLSTSHWIPAPDIARCRDESFREAFWQLLDETAERHPGSRDVLIARSMLFAATGQPAKARHDFDAAVAAGLGTNGNDLEGTHSLAHQLWDTGGRDEAIRTFEIVLKLQQENAGPTAANALKTVHCLGRCYIQAGKFEEAKRLCEDSLELQRLELGSDHTATLTTMTELAEVYLATKNFPHAERLHRELVAFHENKKGEDTVQSLGLLSSLCMALLRQAKYDEAEPLARRCLAGSEKLGPDQWNTFNRKSFLGGALLGQAKSLQSSDPAAAAAKLAEAEPMLLAGYEGMTAREASIPATGKPRLPEALDRIVELYTVLNKPDEAARWQAELNARKAEQPK